MNWMVSHLNVYRSGSAIENNETRTHIYRDREVRAERKKGDTAYQ